MELPDAAWLGPIDRERGGAVLQQHEVVRLDKLPVVIMVATVQPEPQGAARERFAFVLDRGAAPPMWIRFRREDVEPIIDGLRRAAAAMDQEASLPPGAGCARSARSTAQGPRAAPVARLPGERELTDEEAAFCGVTPKPRKTQLKDRR